MPRAQKGEWEKVSQGRQQLRNVCPSLPTTTCSISENTMDSTDDSADKFPDGLVEADGVTNSSARDPPGQSTVHVTHGDHRREQYRLATFAKFPKWSPVKPTELACAGFYWTGFADMVKCYCCGITVENWIQGDKETDPRWHKSDCEIALDQPCDNIPSQYAERKALFVQLSSLARKTTTSPSVHMPCGLQDQTRYHIGQFHGIPMPEVYSMLDGDSRTNNLWKPSRLAEINSPQQKRLILTLDLRKESDRRKTFLQWPSYPAPELANMLAEEGFFYLGDFDRTQCFSCCGVLRNWSKNDFPRNEHTKHFPNCAIIRNEETRNIPIDPAARQRLNLEEHHRIAVLRSISPREPDDPSPEEKRLLALQYPCRNPVNQSMKDEEARLNTFLPSWNENRLKSTPREIAKAGFFFLGQGDRTKCYYCNGGLQNWEESDEPWTEHAKWFPQCEFILRRKGPEFVRRLFDENPNLNRPPIRNPAPIEPPRPCSQSEAMQTFTGPPLVAVATQVHNTQNQGPRERREEYCDENLCRACQNGVREILCQPCRHVSLCSNCANTTQRCPFCNSRIDSTLKIRRS